MVEISTRLRRALAYRLAVGTDMHERHFDAGSMAISGPVEQSREQFAPSLEHGLDPDGVGAIRVIKDPHTGRLVGYYEVPHS